MSTVAGNDETLVVGVAGPGGTSAVSDYAAGAAGDDTKGSRRPNGSDARSTTSCSFGTSEAGGTSEVWASRATIGPVKSSGESAGRAVIAGSGAGTAA